MRFVLFGCIRDRWVALRNSVQTGRSSAKVCATKSRQNFSQRTHPIHPLHRKLTIWCVLFYLDEFGTVWFPYETRSKTGRTSAKVRATKSRRNFLHERTQSTPLDPKLMSWYILHYLGAFGTVWLPYETRCKTAELPQKFVPRSHVGIFCNERT